MTTRSKTHAGETRNFRLLTSVEELLGPRPYLTLGIQNRVITEIWVAGRCPRIIIHDYDWGETDTHPSLDREGYPFTRIVWREAP